MRWWRALVSLGLLALAIYILDFEKLAQALAGLDFLVFVHSVFLNLIAFFILAIRWSVMAKPGIKLATRETLAQYFNATFLNFFTPANLGGDVYRFSSSWQHSVSKTAVLALLFKERLIGLRCYLATYCLSLAWSPESFLSSQSFYDLGSPFLAGAAFSVGFFMLPVFLHVLVRWGRYLDFYFQHRFIQVSVYRASQLQQVLSAPGGVLELLLTLASLFAWCFSVNVVIKGFGIDILFVQLVAILVLVELARLVPITVQGIGLREGAFAYLIAYLGYSAEAGFVASATAFMSLSFAMVLMGPVAYMFRVQLK